MGSGYGGAHRAAQPNIRLAKAKPPPVGAALDLRLGPMWPAGARGHGQQAAPPGMAAQGRTGPQGSTGPHGSTCYGAVPGAHVPPACLYLLIAPPTAAPEGTPYYLMTYYLMT